MNNNSYCCVPQCTSWAKRNPELSFHCFPVAGKSKVYVENEAGERELVDRRKEWIRQLKILKTVSVFMKVCSLHFKETDYFQKGRLFLGKIKRRRLKCNAVPSKNLPFTDVPSSYFRSSLELLEEIVEMQSNLRTDLEETTQQVSTACENILDFEDKDGRFIIVFDES